MADNTEVITLNAEHVAALRKWLVEARRGKHDATATHMVCDVVEGLLRGPLLSSDESVERVACLPGLRSVVTRDKTATISVAPGMPARFLASGVAAALDAIDAAPADEVAATTAAVGADLMDLYSYLADLSMDRA